MRSQAKVKKGFFVPGDTEPKWRKVTLELLVLSADEAEAETIACEKLNNKKIDVIGLVAE